MDQHATGTGEEQDFFKPDTTVAVQAPAQPTPPPAAQNDSFSWTASEFIGHTKTTTWYAALGAVAILVAVALWLITKDVFLTCTILVGMVAFGIYAGRKPRQQTFAIDSRGITIGERQYAYTDFGSFSVTPEGSFLSIELSPLKRFAVYASMYIEPKDEEKVIGLLSLHLPLTPPRNDLADQLLRRIKF